MALGTRTCVKRRAYRTDTVWPMEERDGRFALWNSNDKVDIVSQYSLLELDQLGYTKHTRVCMIL